MKKEKKIGILIFIIAGIFLIFLCYQNASRKAEIPMEDSVKKKSVEEAEEIIIPKWDGDSVKSDFQIKEDFPIREMNEEVLALIKNDTKTLSETMQAYLYSSISEKYTAASFNGIASIDYKTNKIYLTFEIDMERPCTVQGIYDRNKETWEFSEEAY